MGGFELMKDDDEGELRSQGLGGNCEHRELHIQRHGCRKRLLGDLQVGSGMSWEGVC